MFESQSKINCLLKLISKDLTPVVVETLNFEPTFFHSPIGIVFEYLTSILTFARFFVTKGKLLFPFHWVFTQYFQGSMETMLLV